MTRDTSNMLYVMKILDKEQHDRIVEEQERNPKGDDAFQYIVMKAKYEVLVRQYDEVFSSESPRAEKDYYFIKRGSTKIQRFKGKIDDHASRGSCIYVRSSASRNLIDRLGIYVFTDPEVAKEKLVQLTMEFDIPRIEKDLVEAKLVAEGKVSFVDVDIPNEERADSL